MMEYIDTQATKALVGAMLADKAVTRRDLELAFYLYTPKSRKQVIEWFGGSKNRAPASRALKRLSPYLKIDKEDDLGTYYTLKCR